MKRYATAKWLGSGKEGSGALSTQSSILNETPYSFSSRFEQGSGTNPEELVAAAHAGCFSMKLSFVFGQAGFTPESIQTKCRITLEDGRIQSSHLDVAVKIQMEQAQFDACISDAKSNCPISLLLNADITVLAQLN